MRLRAFLSCIALLAACSTESGVDEPARLTGRLVTAEREPAAGWNLRSAAGERAVATDGAGRFALAPLPAGVYGFQASLPGGTGFLTVPVKVHAGAADLGDLVLPAGVRIVISAGEDVSLTEVMIAIDGETAGAPGADGVFLAPSLSPGEHVLRVERAGFPAQVRRLDLRSGVITEIAVALRNPRLYGVDPEIAEWNEIVAVRGSDLAAYAVSGRVQVGGREAATAYWLADEVGVRIPAGIEPGDSEIAFTLEDDVVHVPVAIRPTVLGVSQSPGRIVVSGVNLGAHGYSAGLIGSVWLTGPETIEAVFTDWWTESVTANVSARIEPGDYAVTLTKGLPASTRPWVSIRPRAVPALAATIVTAATVVELTGANLGAAGSIAVGDVPATLDSWDAELVRFRPGPFAPPGTQPVVLSRGDGASNMGTVTVSPTVWAVSPGPIFPGETVTLSGANLGEAAGQLTFGGTAMSPALWTSTQARFAVPITTPGGMYTLVLQAAGITATSDAVAVRPLLAGRSPVAVETGATLTLTGLGFGAARGSSEVLIGGVAVASSVWSSAALAVTVSAAAEPGTTTVQVRVGGQLSNAVTVAVLATGLEPPTGVTATMLAGRRLQLDWIDHATAETAYLVERNEGGGEFAALATLAADAISYVDAGLRAGVTYGYRIVALDGARRSLPGPVSFAAPQATALALGLYSTCVLQWLQPVCWGANTNHQLAPTAPVSAVYAYPTDFTGLTASVAGLSLGAGHACADSLGGELRCWGANDKAQAGIGSSGADLLVPALNLGAGTVDSFAASPGGHTCAIRIGGYLVCWGVNSNRQIGTSSAVTPVTWPAEVQGMAAPVSMVAPGLLHTCAVNAQGVKCWGRNANGQAGAGNFVTPVTWPVQVVGQPAGAVEVTGGQNHTCLRTAAGAVWCWGGNNYGQLGLGYRTVSPAPYSITYPAAVTELPAPAIAITAGYQHTCALVAGGAAYCWGNHITGQLGVSSWPEACGAGASCSARPVAVPLRAAAVELKAGAHHTCARFADGTVDCWGYNLYGQVGAGDSGADHFTPATVAFP